MDSILIKVVTCPGPGDGPDYILCQGTGIAEGNHDIIGLPDQVLIKFVKIITVSTNWNLTLYSKDDYVSGKQVLGWHRDRRAIFQVDYPYQDEDSSGELHFNFIDNIGAATFDIEVRGHSLGG